MIPNPSSKLQYQHKQVRKFWNRKGNLLPHFDTLKFARWVADHTGFLSFVLPKCTNVWITPEILVSISYLELFRFACKKIIVQNHYISTLRRVSNFLLLHITHLIPKSCSWGGLTFSFSDQFDVLSNVQILWGADRIG